MSWSLHSLHRRPSAELLNQGDTTQSQLYSLRPETPCAVCCINAAFPQPRLLTKYNPPSLLMRGYELCPTIKLPNKLLRGLCLCPRCRGAVISQQIQCNIFSHQIFAWVAVFFCNNSCMVHTILEITIAVFLMCFCNI